MYLKTQKEPKGSSKVPGDSMQMSIVAYLSQNRVKDSKQVQLIRLTSSTTAEVVRTEVKL